MVNAFFFFLFIYTRLLTTLPGLGSGVLPEIFFSPLVLLRVKAAFGATLSGSLVCPIFFSDLTGDVKMKPWGEGDYARQVQILFLPLNGLLK